MNLSNPPEQDVMPTIFLAHGSPLTLDDHAWMSEWNR